MKIFRKNITIKLHYHTKTGEYEFFAYNDKGEILVKVTFTKVETNVTFEENYFEVDKNMLAARENVVNGGNEEDFELPLLLTGLDMNINLKDN